MDTISLHPKAGRPPAPAPGPLDLIRFCLIILAVVLVALFAVTSAASPLAGEDYALSTYMPDATLGYRLLWATSRSIEQFTTWNARFGEQLAIVALTMPRIGFVIANTVALLLFAALIGILAQNSTRLTAGLATATSLCIAAIYLLWPRFETFFWISGAGNYFYPLVLNLIVVVAVLVEDCRWGAYLRGYANGLLLVIAFLAGESFENLPPGLFISFGLVAWLRWREGRLRLASALPILTAYALGWITLLMAPSTALRTKFYHDHMDFVGYTPNYLFHRTLNTGRIFLISGWALLTATAIALLLTMKRRRMTAAWDRNLIALFAGATAASAAVIAAPYTEARSFSILWIMLLVHLIRIIMNESPALSRPVQATAAAITGVGALGMAAAVLVDYSAFAARVNARSDAVIAQIGSPQCQTGVDFPLIRQPINHRFMADREIWVEEAPDQMDRYFHCKLIIK